MSTFIENRLTKINELIIELNSLNKEIEGHISEIRKYSANSDVQLFGYHYSIPKYKHIFYYDIYLTFSPEGLPKFNLFFDKKNILFKSKSIEFENFKKISDIFQHFHNTFDINYINERLFQSKKIVQHISKLYMEIENKELNFINVSDYFITSFKSFFYKTINESDTKSNTYLFFNVKKVNKNKSIKLYQTLKSEPNGNLVLTIPEKYLKDNILRHEIQDFNNLFFQTNKDIFDFLNIKKEQAIPLINGTISYEFPNIDMKEILILNEKFKIKHELKDF